MNVVIKISLEELSWFLWISITNWISLNFCSQHYLTFSDPAHVPLCQGSGSGYERGSASFWKRTLLCHRWLHHDCVQGDQGHWHTASQVCDMISFHVVKTLMCYFTCLIQGYRFWRYIVPWVKDDIILLETAVGACAAWDDVMLLLEHALRLWRDMTNFPKS